MSVQSELDLAFQEVGKEVKALKADFSPADHNMLAWTLRPEFVATQVIITAATAQLTRIKIAKSGTITNVYFGVTNVAAGLTSCRIQIFDTTGTLVATTAELTSVVTSTGEKIAALTVPLAVTVGQEYWIVIHAIGTTGPTIRASAALPTINYGLTTSSPLRTGRKTSVTVAPASVTKTDYGIFANQIPLFMLG